MFEQGSTWPSLSYEDRPWHNHQGEYASRAQRRRAAGAYQAAVPAFIAGLDIYVDGELGITTVNAQVAINRLIDAGILTRITKGNRNRMWVAKDVVSVLDEFAARAKRRR